MHDRLLGLLAERGQVWPARIECFETLPSTSDRIKELARTGAPEWTTVLANRQTAGRGRQGSAWVSPPGNLFLSVLLRPAVDAEAIGVLPLAAGAATCEGLRALGPHAAVKWPNDVLVGDRKIAGVLAEATWTDGALEAVTLGIGVNLVLDSAELPADLREATTSLVAETGRPVDRDEAAAEVLARLIVWYHALTRGAAAIVEAWRSLAAPWWGRRVEVRSGHQVVVGVARGVDDLGALLVESDDGRTVRVIAGDARRLRLD